VGENNTSHQYIDDIENNDKQLELFFRRVAVVAGRVQIKARFLMLVGAGTAVWLSYFFYNLLSLSITLTIILIALFGIPAFIFFNLYRALIDMQRLPEKYQSFKKIFQDEELNLTMSIKEMFSKQSKDFSDRNQKYRIRDIFAISKILIEIKNLIGEMISIGDFLGKAVMLMNPIFGLLVVASTVITFFMSLTTLLTVLIFLF